MRQRNGDVRAGGPVNNHDVEEARTYHAATKHSYWSVRLGGHSLDWANKPRPYKVYQGLPVVPLPRDVAPPEAEALEAVGAFPPIETSALDLAGLAQVLFFCAGVTKKTVYPGGETQQFRAASCTGALCEIEIYVVCGNLQGLPPGSITSARLTSPSTGCGKGIFGESLSARRPATRRPQARLSSWC